MTQAVTVQTDFTDLNQMAQGLVGRVNDSHVILPGPEPVDVGEWVQFAVTLFDGTPGFAGMGRCVTVVDNGEDRLQHQRFDVVIDSLQFDSRGQQVFEHILTLNGAGEEGAADALDDGLDDGLEAAAPAAEEVPFEDVSDDFSSSKLELPADDIEDEATMIGESPTALAAVPVTPSAAFAPEEDEDDEFDGDTPMPGVRTSQAAPFAAAAPQPTPPGQINGAAVFSYPEGLPFPAQPPRPQLEPSLRVSRAPRPRA